MLHFSKLATMMPFSQRRPYLLELRSSTWYITVTVCTGIFVDMWLYAVLVPVFPFSLVQRANVAEQDVQHWLSVLLAVYGAALLVGAPISGYCADQFEYRKWPMLAGLFAVTGATVMICLARSLPVLITARILQGLSGSVIWTAGLALLVDTVKPSELARSLGYVALAYSSGTLIAPILGGIIYQRSGYYAVFATTFGVIVLDIIFRLTMIERRAAQKWVDDVSEAHDESTDVETATDVVKGEKDTEAVTCEKTPAPPQHEAMPSSTQPKSLPALILLKSPRLLAAAWGNFVVASTLTGLDTTLTLFVNRTFGWNSLQAGVLYLAPLLPSFFGPLFGMLVDKFGARWISAGGLVMILPFVVLLRTVDHDSIGQIVLLCVLLFFLGTGIALSLCGLMTEFSKVCDEEEKKHPGIFGKGGAYAQSYGIFNVCWAAGCIVGAFWSGGIYSAAGWGTMTWSYGLLCGVSAVPVLLFTDGWIGNRR